MSKILIIDDSVLASHLAKEMLGNLGHQVLHAKDGETGLVTAEEETPDLILLDVIMPGMDGYQVCEKLKGNKKTAEIPVIMLTSKSDPADKVLGLEKGASDYVTKPFDKGELIARVKTHLKLKELYESLQETNRQLQRLANCDGLTGLYNHRYFQETLARDFDRVCRYKEFFSLLLFDIDFFKKFNDTYGHQVGDIVLKTLGGLITEVKRNSDLSARYGGEEFVLILYHTDKEGAAQIAERLRSAVESHTILHDGLELKVTISIGVACFPNEEIQDTKTLISCADIALYKAKELGRNQVVVYGDFQN